MGRLEPVQERAGQGKRIGCQGSRIGVEEVQQVYLRGWGREDLGLGVTKVVSESFGCETRHALGSSCIKTWRQAFQDEPLDSILDAWRLLCHTYGRVKICLERQSGRERGPPDYVSLFR